MLSDVELAEMQGTIQDAMPDQGTITRAGIKTVSAVTGDSTAGAPTVIYSGDIHVRVPDSNELDVLFGDSETTTQRYVATVPAATVGILNDDQLVLSESSATALIGVPMRVTFVTTGTYNLGVRVALEVIES